MVMMVAGAFGVVAFAVMVVMVLVLVLILVMVMVMMVLVLVLILVMVMVVMMLMFVLIMVIMMVMVVFFFLRLMLGADALHQLLLQRHLFHGGQNGLAVQLIPGSGDNGSRGIFLPQQRHSRLQLICAKLLGAAEDDGSGSLHLIVVEFAEVFHIHLHPRGIRHGDKGIQFHVRHILHRVLHCQNHIRQLAHAGGLDQNAVRRELLFHILQRPAEITHQGAADAPGGHFADLHAGLLQKAAVNADLAKLVFNDNQLFALIGFFQQLFNQRCLACAQKAGYDVYFCHDNASFPILHSRFVFILSIIVFFAKIASGLGKKCRHLHKKFANIRACFPVRLYFSCCQTESFVVEWFHDSPP